MMPNWEIGVINVTLFYFDKPFFKNKFILGIHFETPNNSCFK